MSDAGTVYMTRVSDLCGTGTSDFGQYQPGNGDDRLSLRIVIRE